jgi:hypothetical protein
MIQMVRTLNIYGTIFAILFSLSGMAWAAVEGYPIPEHGKLLLDIPDSIDASIEQPADNGPPGILLRPRQNPVYAVLVVVSWRTSEDADFGTDSHLQRVLRSEAAPYLEQLGLKDISPTKLSTDGHPGYAYTLVDSSLIDKPPQPGEFPYLRQGVIVVGELLLKYNIFMHFKDPDPVPGIERILGTAVHEAAED